MSQESFFDLRPEKGEHGGRGEFDLREYLAVLQQRWKLIVACALIGTTVGVIHYQITPRLYKAVTTVQIERKAMNPNPTSVNQMWMENWWNLEYYPTQYRLLESRGLAERVVQDLRLYEDPFFHQAQALRGPENVSEENAEPVIADGKLTLEPG